MLGRQPGEPLCPERYDISELTRIKAAVGQAWEPLYQQNPQPAGAGAAYTNFGQWNISEEVEITSGIPLSLFIDFNSNPGMHCVVGQHIENADLSSSPTCFTSTGSPSYDPATVTTWCL